MHNANFSTVNQFNRELDDVRDTLQSLNLENENEYIQSLKHVQEVLSKPTYESKTFKKASKLAC